MTACLPDDCSKTQRGIGHSALFLIHKERAAMADRPPTPPSSRGKESPREYHDDAWTLTGLVSFLWCW